MSKNKTGRKLKFGVVTKNKNFRLPEQEPQRTEISNAIHQTIDTFANDAEYCKKLQQTNKNK